MPLNEVIPQQAESAIASFDYYDIAEGTGIKAFYLGVSEDDSGNDYHLVTQELYSDEIDTAITTFDGTTYDKELDLDFDLAAFNMPKTIKGTGYIQFSEYELTTCSAGQSVNGYFVFKLRKWDGTTETEIASATSKTYGFGYETTPTARTETGFIPITIPETPFAPGEQLRLTMECWTKTINETGGSGTFAIGHDPKNRDGTYIKPSTDDPESVTKTTFFCPFKIEL